MKIEKGSATQYERSMVFYFYILRCSDNSLYCGVTNNPERRVREHNSNNSKASRFTRTRQPVKLVYAEEYKDLKSAMRRELQIKKWPKAKKEALISDNRQLLKKLSKKL